MKLKITVNSVNDDTPYGGEQTLDCEAGEFRLDDIFRLPFFRVIIDDIIDGAVCFRLMEGAEAHYFVLEGPGDTASWSRETPLGEDSFDFSLEE
ncbi:MAG: hypothetical protein LUD29_03465 [Clostridia bacterium]|nr:hypothetical protein [Clostridia bacterium]